MTWRDLLARAPLPMLALAASYGVYSYNILFMPAFFAVAAAAAFELTYVALAFLQTPDRGRARNVAFAAVAVSVIYNTLAGLFHRQPAILDDPSLVFNAGLALLHGAPLAVIAYNLSVLLVHEQPLRDPSQSPRDSPQGVQVNIAVLAGEPRTVREWVRGRAQALLQEEPTLSQAALAVRLGTSPDTIRRALVAEIPAAAPAEAEADLSGIL